MSIAYAPRIPAPALPWLIEVDPHTGAIRALLADRDGNVLNVARRHSPESRHPSLDDMCRTYALSAARDLELRWWEGTNLTGVVTYELERLGIDGTVHAAQPGVRVERASGAVHLPSAFALRTWERTLNGKR